MKSKLQELIAKSLNDEGCSLDNFVTANTEWSRKDILHYLSVEKDPIRLARWCQLYLQLDY
jgi:hypothetical protein